MSLDAQFGVLVRDLDQDMLRALERVVARERNARDRLAGIGFEDIHPNMSAAAKDEAARQIARVLRGEE